MMFHNSTILDLVHLCVHGVNVTLLRSSHKGAAVQHPSSVGNLPHNLYTHAAARGNRSHAHHAYSGEDGYVGPGVTSSSKSVTRQESNTGHRTGISKWWYATMTLRDNDD